MVEYSAFLDRGAFFVAGDYDKCQIPSQEVIKLPKISGFDAYFECIITCKHEVVVINFNGWMPKSFSGSKTIISRVLDNESYQNLRKYAGNDLIKIH